MPTYQPWSPPQPKKTIVFRIDEAQHRLLEELVARATANGQTYPRTTASSLVRQAIALGLVELEKKFPKKKPAAGAIAKRNTLAPERGK